MTRFSGGTPKVSDRISATDCARRSDRLRLSTSEPTAVGVALDQDHLVGVVVEHAQHRARDALELRILVGRHLPGPELEGDGVEIDAAQAVAQLVVVAHLLQRVGALERLDRRRHQRLVEVVVGGAIVVDDVLLARDRHARPGQVEGMAEPDRADADGDAVP